MEILRNMWRRKFRTLLTIIGISVGIFAFTVMGSMAIKLNKMIAGGKRYITGQITIMPKGSNIAMGAVSGMLPVDTLNKISQIEGVEGVQPLVSLAVEDPDPDNPQSSGMSMSGPPTIYGSPYTSKAINKNWTTLDMKEGEMLKQGDADNLIAIGFNIALDKKLKVSDTWNIRGRGFKIKGVVDKTNTGPDSYVFMSITPARELLVESNPFLKSLKEQSDKAANVTDAQLKAMPPEQRKQVEQAKAFKMEDLSSMAAVSWKDGADSEVVSNRIKDQFKKDILVMSPKKMGEEIDKGSAIINAIILGSAALALIVGTFSIVNTMVMSISERTKEIGIKKALGASRFSIAWDYTLESGIIALFGGLLGLGLGYLVIYLANSKLGQTGAEIFMLTPQFAAAVVAFSFVLGIVAGVLPALRAARLKVVDAIREL